MNEGLVDNEAMRILRHDIKNQLSNISLLVAELKYEIVNPSPAMELPIISLRYGVASPPNPRLKAIATNQHYGVPVVNGGVPMLFAESTAFARRAPEGPTIANGEFRLKLFGLC